MNLKNNEKEIFKRNLIYKIYAETLKIIEESDFYASERFPKNGFYSGYKEPSRNDSIGIVISIGFETDFKLLQFNIWTSNMERAKEMHLGLSLIFDNAISNKILYKFDFDLAAYRPIIHKRPKGYMTRLGLKLVLN